IRDPLVTGVQTCALPISARQMLRLNSRVSPNSQEMAACPFLGRSEPAVLTEAAQTGRAGRERTIADWECPGCALGAQRVLLRVQIGRASCREECRGWWGG